MAFPLVFVQNFPDLQIKRIIALPQMLGQCFMDGGFGNAELLCGFADSGTGLNHVHSQFTGALFWVCCHALPSDAVLLNHSMLYTTADMQP